MDGAQRTKTTGTLIMQTIVAAILALVVYFIVSTLAAMAIYYLQVLFTIIRPGILMFMAVVIGSFVGMNAARWSCDAILRDYSGRAVFVFFALLAVVLAFGEVMFVPRSWNQLNSAGQLVSALVASYWLFWRGDDF